MLGPLYTRMCDLLYPRLRLQKYQVVHRNEPAKTSSGKARSAQIRISNFLEKSDLSAGLGFEMHISLLGANDTSSME